MSFDWASVAGNVAGSLVGGIFGHNSANAAYKRQVDMYKHRYQWQTEDLKAAGLNPILSVTGGGLAAPVQAAPTPENPAWSAGLSNAINSAFSTSQNKERIDIDRERLALDQELGAVRKDAISAEVELSKAKTLDTFSTMANNSAKTAQEIEESKSRIANQYDLLQGQLKLFAAQARSADAAAAHSYAMADLNIEQKKMIMPNVLKIAEETIGIKLDNAIKMDKKILSGNFADAVAAHPELFKVGHVIDSLFPGLIKLGGTTK